MIRGPIDGKYVELWGIPAWRRKLGIGDESLTLTQRIESIISGTPGGSPDSGPGSVDNANARLAAFATLEVAGYVVQTSTFPPTFAGRHIVGTDNQIHVTNGTGINGNTLLQTPQDIHAGAIPEFQTIKPSLLNPGFVTFVNAVGELDSTGVTADAINTIAIGTPGYFPYWLNAPGGLSSTSPIYTDGTFTGIGLNTWLVDPVTPDAPLHVWVHDFNTGAVTDLLKLYHGVAAGSGTLLGVGGGTGLLFSGASASVINRDMARISTRWVTATDATRGAALDFMTGTAGGALTTAMSILDTGRVAVGTLTSPSAIATFVSAINPTTAGISGILNTVTITPTASTGNGAQGFQSASTLAGTFRSGSSTSILGSISVTNTSSSNGNTVGVTAVKGNANTSGSGQAANLSALEAIWSHASTGTVSSFYGLRINSIVANAGTITNTYGIHIGDVTLGTQTNNAYSIFASDANAWCHFAGRVGIGTTLPGVMLDLGLSGTTLGVMRLAGNTSGNVTIQPAAIAGTWTLTLPINDGNLGDMLTTDGGGITSWTAPPATISTPVSIANGGTFASSFSATDGVVYFDGTRLVNSADLFYSSSELVSRGVSLNGTNEPYAARNINTGANAGTGYEAELADTSNNILTAGYITWTKEQSWTTVAGTRDSTASIATTLDNVTTTALDLKSSGSVICGKDGTGTTRTDDFTYICTSNGVPTGVPTTFGSRVPMTFDPNTDTFYIYRGGWKGVVVT